MQRWSQYGDLNHHLSRNQQGESFWPYQLKRPLRCDQKKFHIWIITIHKFAHKSTYIEQIRTIWLSKKLFVYFPPYKSHFISHSLSLGSCLMYFSSSSESKPPPASRSCWAENVIYLYIRIRIIPISMHIAWKSVHGDNRYSEIHNELFGLDSDSTRRAENGNIGHFSRLGRNEIEVSEVRIFENLLVFS